MTNKKTIVITGATSGLGNLLVKEYIKQDYRVFAGFRNSKLKKELAELSENVVPFRIDMSKNWSVKEAIKFINSNTEKIDVLINAAGCVVAGPLECLSTEKIKEQFEVNTFSQIELTQGLFEKLQGGKIINISSTSSFGVYPFIAPYCASKRALDILFNTLQIECNNAVKVISIKPGVIKTPLWEKSIEANKAVLECSEKYQKEACFLVENAQKNAQKGLEAQRVVDLIIKIEGLENPKPSYTVGLDAKCAEILSHLPQRWINFIVRKMLEKRCMN